MKQVHTKVIELMARKQQKTKVLINATAVVEGTGLARPTVANWMKGRVTRFDETTIVRFCDYFECDIGDLLALVDGDGEGDE